MAVAGQKPSISFRAEGNLFLCDADGLTSARRIFDMHKSLGSNAEWLEPEEIKRRWPLYNMEGVAAGTFGPTDGHLDAYGLLMAYKTKARSLGCGVPPGRGRFPDRGGRTRHRRAACNRPGSEGRRHRQLRRGLGRPARAHGRRRNSGRPGAAADICRGHPGQARTPPAPDLPPVRALPALGVRRPDPVRPSRWTRTPWRSISTGSASGSWT